MSETTRKPWPAWIGRAAATAKASVARGGILLGVLLLALVWGCTPESRSPLPPADKVAPDARMIGRWVGKVEGAEYIAEITQSDPLTLNVALIETLPVGKNPQTQTAYRINAYAVGSRTVLGIQEITSKRGNWRFAVPVFSGDDQASLLFMDDRFVRPEVHRTALSGGIRNDDPNFPDILITAKPKELANFIRRSDESRLFAVAFGPFERLP